MWHTPSYRTSVDRIEAAKKSLEAANKEHERLMARTRVKCSCGCSSMIKNLPYIKTHWYTRPYSCSGGDYWNEGEGLTECPNCKARLRITHFDKRFEGLQKLFKEIIKEYKD